MAVQYWMISNRNVKGSSLGSERDTLRYYTSDGGGAIDSLSSWDQCKTKDEFQNLLARAANKFPVKPDSENLDQKHVTIFIHGFNNSWQDAAKRYQQITQDMFAGKEGMGICMFFTWPSEGSVAGYLPDRREARESADDLAEVLSDLYDWLIDKQAEVIEGTGPGCKAKTSIIAHSMGNYVLQCAMQNVWTRKNRPLLVSLINQLLMVAADVDNDIFKSGEDIGDGDGEGLANLTYRITALYSGRDSVLGASAGLKHFGKRRLGRSGLDRSTPLPDNVWDVDCSNFFSANESNIHSAYFTTRQVRDLMVQVLRGVDRGVLVDQGFAPNEDGMLQPA
jgi:esterase/lipase superfamily enzyme